MTTDHFDLGVSAWADPDYTEPVVYEAIDDEPEFTEAAAAHWDLAFGCTLSVTGAEPGGALQVAIHMSDQCATDAMCVRDVTVDQVLAHARHLLRIAVPAEQWEYGIKRLGRTEWGCTSQEARLLAKFWNDHDVNAEIVRRIPAGPAEPAPQEATR